MKLVIISPEDEEPREFGVLRALFADGLERYDLRKPGWSSAQLEAWLRKLGSEYFSRIVIHQHHGLVGKLGLGGRHWRDDLDAPQLPSADLGITSRACHTLDSLADVLGHYDTVLVSPIFPSISKPDHHPNGKMPIERLQERLLKRAPAERRTAVVALGGIKPENIERCVELGFNGIAVLGAIWQADDPRRVFRTLQQSLLQYAN